MHNILRSLASAVSISLFVLTLARAPTVLAADQQYNIVQSHQYLFEKGIEILKAKIPGFKRANNFYTYRTCQLNLPCFRYSFDGYLGNTPGAWTFTAVGKRKKVLTQFGRKKILHFYRTGKRARFRPYGHYRNAKYFNLRNKR